MNPKISKLRTENEKDRAKVEALLERIKGREDKIQELENTEILGMVHEIGMTPEQLAQLLKNAPTIMKQEDNPNEKDQA